jgi:negative regulator of flagellin synthesis FlgM
MTIERIGNVEPIQPNQQPERASPIRKTVEADSVSVSAEAIAKAELARAIEIVSAAPYTQQDRVAELKAKINDPSYLTNAVLTATADSIMEAFGI